MGIDPRWVSTPVGAAIGIVLARKLLKPEDRTLGKTVLGGAIGGLGGYTAGSFVEGDPWDLVPGKDRAKNIIKYRNWVAKKKPTGPLSGAESAMAENILPTFRFDEKDRIRYNIAQPRAADLHEYRQRMVRATVLENAAAIPNIDERNRKALLNAAEATRKAADIYKKEIGGGLPGWSTPHRTIYPAIKGALQDLFGYG